MALPAGMSACNLCVEIMSGTSWTDVSDSMSVVEPPSMPRESGEAPVFGEDIYLVTFGKRTPLEVTVRGVWAEGTADPFYTVYLAHTTPCGALNAVRWSPAGCATSSDAFSTSTTNSKIVDLVFPAGDAADGSPIMYQFVVKTPDLTRAAWA